jgi:hypothetical protein
MYVGQMLTYMYMYVSQKLTYLIQTIQMKDMSLLNLTYKNCILQTHSLTQHI